MLKIKSTVRPRALFIAAACINVAIEQRLTIDIVITSGNDSKHMNNSLHYTGDALDVRSKEFTSKEAKLNYIEAVIDRLGHSFQGILEDEGKDNEHFHFEFDPS